MIHFYDIIAMCMLPLVICWRNTENAGQYHCNVYITTSNMCHLGGILRMQDNIIAMCMLPLVTCVMLEEY